MAGIANRQAPPGQSGAELGVQSLRFPWRGIATRYGKRPDRYLAAITLAGTSSGSTHERQDTPW